MTSRRSFLLSCSSAPLLSVAGHLVAAKTLEANTLPEITSAQLDSEHRQAAMAIYGWHTPDIDQTQVNLISLTASWKADWL